MICKLAEGDERYEEDEMLRVRDFVEAQLYEDEEAVIQDALRHLLRARTDLRIRLAIHRYQAEGISLAKAASLAGVSWAQMKDILVEYGVEPRLGPETVEEAQEEVAVLRAYFEGRACRPTFRQTCSGSGQC
jgi:predicted HTH domain antitoxin